MNIAFYGPFQLSGSQNPSTIASDFQSRVPGGSTTSYPGAGGGGIGALGFTSPGPLLYQGQAPSTLDQVFASSPMRSPHIEGVTAQPESLTGTLAGLSPLSSVGGPAEPGGMTPPSLTDAAPTATAPTAPAAPTGQSFGHLGNPVGNFVSDVTNFIGDVQSNSPIGKGVAALGLQGLPGQIATGLIGQALNQAFPIASLVNFGIGVATPAPPATPAQVGFLGNKVNQMENFLSSPPAEPSAPPATPPASQFPTDLFDDPTGFTGGTPGAPGNGPGAPGNGPTGPGSSSGGVPGGADNSPTDPGAGATGPGGDSTVICTELRRQGYLDDATWEADQAFGASVRREAPEVYAGYMRWAPTVVGWMRASRTITRLTAVIARPWAREMYGQMTGTRGSIVGALLMAGAVPVCRWLGRGRVAAYGD